MLDAAIVLYQRLDESHWLVFFVDVRSIVGVLMNEIKDTMGNKPGAQVVQR